MLVTVCQVLKGPISPADNTYNNVYIILKDRLGALFKMEEEYTIIEEMRGAALVGKKYRPLFKYFIHLKSEEEGRGAFRIVR